MIEVANAMKWNKREREKKTVEIVDTLSDTYTRVSSICR